MERVNGFDQKAQLLMINELLQGLESVKEFRNQFIHQANKSATSDDHQTLIKSLVEKMHFSFDKTIAIAKLMNVEVPHQDFSNPNNMSQLESPHSFSIGSPRSENSHPDLRASKRRKTMPRWTKTVQITEGSVSGLEGPLDDGFNWRKYGQKDILGAKFPRGYYRCTHRHSKGCTATKQVQRSDEDSSIYQVMYRGEHICNKNAHLHQAHTKPTPTHIKTEPLQPPSSQQHYTIPQSLQQEVFVGLGLDGGLKVEQEETLSRAQIFRSFSFNSALLEPQLVDNFILSCSPAFGSPATSESNHVPASPYKVDATHVGLNVQTSESDLNGPVSDPNSVTNSPIAIGDDFEFPLDQWLEIDPNFSFEFAP